MTGTFVYIDNKEVPIENEQNLLELIRKARIDLPTFCYHSELSIYGACRLCMVEVDGMGLVPACSTPPSAEMKVSTNTGEIRNMRKIIVELLLANHSQNCPTCQKSTTCQLQALAKRLGITKVRFKNQLKEMPADESSPSIIRDPNKCVLCGDCVRIWNGSMWLTYYYGPTGWLRQGAGSADTTTLFEPGRPVLVVRPAAAAAASLSQTATY